MKTPKNRTFTFAMTESNLKAYMDNWHYASYTVSERTSGIIIMLLCVTAAAALLLPFFSTLHTGGERIFRCPVEIVVAAAFFGYIIPVSYTHLQSTNVTIVKRKFVNVKFTLDKRLLHNSEELQNALNLSLIHI